MNQATRLRLKSVICGAALASASISANAAIYPLGALTPGAAPTSLQGTVIPGGPFTDFFTFSMPASGGSGYSILNFPVAPLFAATFSSLKLYSDTNGIPGDTIGETLKATGAGSPTAKSLTFGAAPAGSYYLEVVGLASGTTGGLYSGAISVSPVPEPEIWAMLLVGTGLVGFQLRRKSKAAQANRLTLA